MVKNKIIKNYNKFKHSKFFLIYLVLLIFILVIVSVLLVESLIEKEAINSQTFSGNKPDFQLSNVNDYTFKSTDSKVFRKIDSDIRPILSKSFGTAKVDKHLLIESKLRNNYHMFYFTKIAPTAKDFRSKFISQIEKNVDYVKKEYDDERTFEYYLNFDNEKYLVIFSLLNYNSKDSMGIYMVYILKLNN